MMMSRSVLALQDVTGMVRIRLTITGLKDIIHSLMRKPGGGREDLPNSSEALKGRSNRCQIRGMKI